MLAYLKIKNFAIIDEIELEFTNNGNSDTDNIDGIDGGSDNKNARNPNRKRNKHNNSHNGGSACGMVVITGETGAGKSLIVDTLSLILGDRADSNMIKAGAERCEITAIFDLTSANTASSHTAQSWLHANEFDDSPTPTECTIYRTFNRDGRSRSTINGAPTTLQAVKELGQFLVDIHSQHEHHSLLKNDTQRNLLDVYAGCDKECAQLKQLHTAWSKLQKECSIVAEQAQNGAAKIDFLNYQLKELSDLFGDSTTTPTAPKAATTATAISANPHDLSCAAPTLTLLNTLKHEHSLLSNAEEIMRNCQAALSLAAGGDGSSYAARSIDGNDSNSTNTNILAQLATLKHLIEKIKNKDPQAAALENICKLWESATINIEEGISELQHYLDHIELNQEKLTTLEGRLQKIYELARKHKVKPEELPHIITNLTTELAQLEQAEAKLHIVQKEISKIEEEYNAIANTVSAARRDAATKLSALVTTKMHSLGMPDGKFAVDVSINAAGTNSNAGNVQTTQRIPSLPLTTQLTPHGYENIEFQVTANAGQPLQPLYKVASGGELSRISLALQVILTNKTTTPTIIFDEVDVGIGGKVAEIVGILLRELGRKCQVICVTHLPQVASCGMQHWRVEKTKATTTATAKTKTPITIAHVIKLTAKERINEIARMLGGIEITDRTLAHAEEMLHKNHT
jgi:DNA repair protein RecN (Recombination protein N)